MSESVFLWLAAYLAHSTLLLGGAMLLEQTRRVRTPAARELLWRFAMFAGIVTATVQTAWPAGALELARDALLRPVATLASENANANAHEDIPVAVALEPASRPADSSASHPAWAAPEAREKTATLVLPARTRAPANWIVAAWLGLATLGLLRLAVLLLRRQRALGRMEKCDAGSLERITRRLCAAQGLPAPRLLLDPASSSPTANLGDVLTLPRWAADGIDERSAEAMLAHELGHVARGDARWRLLAATLKAVLWCQPLNAYAARRLEALAELGADEWALRVTGNPRALAECLARCARELPLAPAPMLAVAMAGSSPLVARIQRILEEGTMKTAGVHPGYRLLVAAVLVVGIAALPTIAIEQVAAKGGNSHIEISDNGFGESYSKVKIDQDGVQLEAEFEGKFRFNDAEDDLASLGDGDEAYIEQEIDGVERRMDWEGAGGKVVRQYSVDGRKQPLDAAGAAWLRQVIPLLLRESGIDAEARVARLHKRGGADLVLKEIGQMRGDYSRRVYFSTLAGHGELTPAQLDRAIAIIATLGSDYERRESLVALVDRQDLAPAQQVAVLGAVATMDSDYEQRTVLEKLSRDLADDEAVGRAWGKAIAAIDSSYERRTAITAIADRDDLSPAMMGAALNAIGSMKSDYEQRTALSELAPHLAADGRSAATYARTATTIGSDYERREALLALPSRSFADAGVARAVLDATEGMKSSYEQRQVLVAVASKMPADAALIARYREIARGMDSYERGQAEEALDRLHD